MGRTKRRPGVESSAGRRHRARHRCRSRGDPSPVGALIGQGQSHDCENRVTIAAPRGEDLTMTQPAQSNGSGVKPRQDMISGAYLRNAWYVAAWSDGVGDGQLVPRTIMDEPIVLFRKADGAVAAIADRCAHRF